MSDGAALDDFVTALAHETGVDAAGIRAVLQHLGIDHALDALVQGGRTDAMPALSAQNVGICIRHENMIYAKG